MLIVAWVTSGFVAPSVHARSGSPAALAHEFGGGTGSVGAGTSAPAVVGIGGCCEGSTAALGVAAPQPTARPKAIATLAARRRASHPFTSHPSREKATRPCTA